jgi:hypothetical protein
MKKNNRFNDQIDDLNRAIKIGGNIIKHTSDLSEKEKQDYLSGSLDMQNVISNLEEKYKNKKSLAYLEDNFYTYWNESIGKYVEEFWKSLSNNNIGYKRKDILNDTLKRGRIKNIYEYNTIQDGLVVAFQEKKITQDEMVQLSSMLSRYEEKNRGKV